MNKSIQTTLAFLSLFLTPLSWGQKDGLVKVWDAELEASSGIETSQSTQAPNLQTGWIIVTHEEKPAYTVFFDGGSIGIHFKKNDESVGLYHDRSYKTLKNRR